MNRLGRPGRASSAGSRRDGGVGRARVAAPRFPSSTAADIRPCGSAYFNLKTGPRSGSFLKYANPNAVRAISPINARNCQRFRMVTTVPSPLAEARSAPSWLNASRSMSAVCPVRVRAEAPVETSQSLTSCRLCLRPSSQLQTVVASPRPSGLKANPSIPRAGSVRLRTS